MKASVLGGVIKHPLVRRVMQNRRSAFHRVENAAFAFDAQRLWCYAFPLLGTFRSTRIHRASLDNLLVALFIGDLRQPIAEPVRLEAPFLSSRAACRGEICSTMPRAITSSAISRPVH